MDDEHAKDGKIRTEFIDAGGMHFEVHTCGDDASEKLALLLHGFPEHAISWRHQLPMLARLGYRVWAPNQRGYGRTGRPPRVLDYSLDKLVGDVGALIEASGAKSVTLFGHDWGGGVAWAAALSGVPRIDRLVVMNLPHPRKFAEALASSWRQRLRSWYVLLFQIPKLPEWLLGRNRAQLIADTFQKATDDPSRFPPEVIEIYRENALQPGALTAMINWYRAAVRIRKGVRDRLLGEGMLDTPTLMVWGENDLALGKELTYGTEKLVTDFTIRYLPTSHWVNQEMPEETNAIVEAWLTGKPVPDFSSTPLLSQSTQGESSP
jgi:pimeloyl-ACP methyl ester carboxylesterase